MEEIYGFLISFLYNPFRRWITLYPYCESVLVLTIYITIPSSTLIDMNGFSENNTVNFLRMAFSKVTIYISCRTAKKYYIFLYSA